MESRYNLKDTPLDMFIAKRRLTEPTGRPLYTYRCDAEEYSAVREWLSYYSETAARPKDYSAGFVLFVSQWWQRNYEGGPWSWDPVLRELGDANKLLGFCSDWVEKGLTWWGRALRQDGRGFAYLGSCVTEGGFPLIRCASGNNVTHLP